MAISFYSTRDKYGEFSNFSRHPVYLDGKRYPTSEHYFQAQKFARTEPDYEEKIRLAKSAREAADMGRSRAHKLRPDWESVKDDVMLAALRAKFTQHQELRQLLLTTGDEELIEASPTDLYWGTGADGQGKNMLGQLLVQVRQELKANS